MKFKLNYTIIGIISLYIILIGVYIWTSFKNKYITEKYTNHSYIPKIIHMTCKDKNNMSEFYKTNYNSWKTKHEQNGWEIRLYDDDDLIDFFNTYYPYIHENIVKTYDKIIYKVDIFKILVLNKIGGVYVDMDVECLKPIDELIENTNDKVIFGYGPYEHNNGQYKDIKLIECAIMMSEPNHAFWTEYAIPNLKPKNKCNGHAVVCTGPLFITNVVEKYNRENTTNDIKVMEPVYFYPVNNQLKGRISDTLINKTQNMLKTRNFPAESYCVHYFDGAWWNKNSKGNKK